MNTSSNRRSKQGQVQLNSDMGKIGFVDIRLRRTPVRDNLTFELGRQADGLCGRRGQFWVELLRWREALWRRGSTG